MPLDSNDDIARRRAEALERHNDEKKPAAETPQPIHTEGAARASAAGNTASKKSRDLDREEALHSHQDEQGASGGLVGAVSGVFTGGARQVKNFFRAAYEVTARKLKWVGPVVKPFVIVAKWSAPKLYRAAVWTVPKMFTRKGLDKRRHFSLIRSSFSLAAIGICLALTPHYIPYIYYHATESTYHIYVPNAGVFHNQQFNNPNQSGQVIAPRDEISTVFPKYINEKGELEQTRFDIDSNGYFLFFRPDLAAAQLTPQSPYGAECTVKATGFYTLVPRYLRAPSVMRILNLRPEIVGVVRDNGPIAQARKAAGLEETDRSSSCAQLTEAEYEKVFGVRHIPAPPPKPAEKPGTTPPVAAPEQKAPAQTPAGKTGVPVVSFPGLGQDGRNMADWLNNAHPVTAPRPFADLAWNGNDPFALVPSAHGGMSPQLG